MQVASTPTTTPANSLKAPGCRLRDSFRGRPTSRPRGQALTVPHSHCFSFLITQYLDFDKFLHCCRGIPTTYRHRSPAASHQADVFPNAFGIHALDTAPSFYHKVPWRKVLSRRMSEARRSSEMPPPPVLLSPALVPVPSTLKCTQMCLRLENLRLKIIHLLS